MARFDIINRSSGVRKFPAGGRYLTLAGGEAERNIELTNEEAEALRATNEFHVRELGQKDDKSAAQGDAQKPAADAQVKTVKI